MNKDLNWYLIYVKSGAEESIKNNMDKKIKNLRMEDSISKVVIPQLDKVEIRNGRRNIVTTKPFPGYIIVYMSWSDTTYQVVKNTTGVYQVKQIPLTEEEAKNMLGLMNQKAELSVWFDKGDHVMVNAGPFKDFLGTVDNFNESKGRVTIIVNLLGKESKVEINSDELDKV